VKISIDNGITLCYYFSSLYKSLNNVSCNHNKGGRYGCKEKSKEKGCKEKDREEKDRKEKDREEKDRKEKDREEKDREEKDREEKDREEKDREEKNREEKDREEKDREEKNEEETKRRIYEADENQRCTGENRGKQTDSTNRGNKEAVAVY
jgi:hypothetical protein